MESVRMQIEEALAVVDVARHGIENGPQNWKDGASDYDESLAFEKIVDALKAAYAPALRSYIDGPGARDALVGYSVFTVSPDKYATVTIDRGTPGTLMHKRDVATGAPNGEYFNQGEAIVLPMAPGAEIVLRVNRELRECMLAVNGSKFRIVVEPILEETE